MKTPIFFPFISPSEMAAWIYEEEDEDEEEDTESLSQRIKRLKGGEFESRKGDVQAQSNFVSMMGNDQHKPSSVKIEVHVATTQCTLILCHWRFVCAQLSARRSPLGCAQLCADPLP